MSNIYNQMPNIGLRAAVAVAHIQAIEMDKERDARIEAIAKLEAQYAPFNPYPIVHQHGQDLKGALSHCMTLTQGGWIAKVKRTPEAGWHVVIKGFRGVHHAHPVC